MNIHCDKFELGRIMFTPAALDAAEANDIDLIHLIVSRHVKGDWGDLSAEDAAENEFALDKYLRIFSSYVVKGIKFWIITDADRRATTVLLPEDY